MKKCEYCNTENNEQATHCEKCGIAFVIQQPVEEVPKEPKEGETPPKQKKKKLLPIILGAVALVLVAVLVVVSLLTDGKKTDPSFSYAEYNMFILENRGKPLIGIQNAEQIWEEDIAIHRFMLLEKSKSGTCALFSDIMKEGLFLADETGVTKIAEGEAEEYVISLSDSGTALAYMKRGEKKLYFQQIPATSDPIVIDVPSIDEGTSANLYVSLEGKSLIYVFYENEIPVTYLYRDGKSEKLGEKMYPYVFSDTAEYFFCYEAGTKDLYIGNFQKEFQKLDENINVASPIINLDFSQCLFMKDDEWHVVENGSVVTKTTGVTTAEINTLVTPELAIKGNSRYPYVKDLCGNYYCSSKNDQLFYLDENWNWTLLHEEIEDCSRGDGEDVIYYTARNMLFGGTDLYRVEGGNTENAKLICDTVADFCVSEDGNSVYYIDFDNCLWLARGEASPVLLAEKVEVMRMTHDNYLLFTVSVLEGAGQNVYDLYASKNGGKPIRLEKNNVFIISTNSSATYYSKMDDEGSFATLYGAEKGLNFKVVTENFKDYTMV